MHTHNPEVKSSGRQDIHWHLQFLNNVHKFWKASALDYGHKQRKKNSIKHTYRHRLVFFVRWKTPSNTRNPQTIIAEESNKTCVSTRPCSTRVRASAVRPLIAHPTCSSISIIFSTLLGSYKPTQHKVKQISFLHITQHKQYTYLQR